MTYTQIAAALRISEKQVMYAEQSAFNKIRLALLARGIRRRDLF
jgi:DNA-directed RNA polymerase specialized sigma24 family protein